MKYALIIHEVRRHFVVVEGDSEDEARDQAAGLSEQDFDAMDIGGSWEAGCVGEYPDTVPLDFIIFEHLGRSAGG